MPQFYFNDGRKFVMLNMEIECRVEEFYLSDVFDVLSE